MRSLSRIERDSLGTDRGTELHEATGRRQYLIVGDYDGAVALRANGAIGAVDLRLKARCTFAALGVVEDIVLRGANIEIGTSAGLRARGLCGYQERAGEKGERSCFCGTVGDCGDSHHVL